LKVPDPYRDAELSQMLKATRLTVQAIGDKAFILARADQGPFSLACEIRGMSELMLDIALGEKTAHIHRLLDFCRQVVTRYACAQIEQGTCHFDWDPLDQTCSPHAITAPMPTLT
jgi:uroporphyrinogen decarboxylase